jgi:ankyrin repeat protein
METAVENANSLSFPELAEGEITCLHNLLQIGKYSTEEIAYFLCRVDAIAPIVMPQVQEGTFQWVLSHQTYQEWLNTDSQPILHVIGKPGCGKSVLSGFLRAKLIEDTKWIATAYHSYHESDESSGLEQIYASLIAQVLYMVPSLFQVVEPMYLDPKKSVSWSGSKLRSYFAKLIQRYPKAPMIFIIDGLDECDSTRAEFISALIESIATTPWIKVAIFSRPEADILLALQSATQLNMDTEIGMKKDLDTFISAEVEHLVASRRFLLSVKTQIAKSLRERADGMFLLVRLILDSLYTLKQTSRATIRNVLNSLPTTLSSAYAKIFERIDVEYRPWAKRALVCVLHATRPLTINELASAIALRTDTEKFEDIEDEISLDLLHDLRSIIGPVLKVDTDRVRVSHQTVKDFLCKNADSKSHGLGPNEDVTSATWCASTRAYGNQELLRICIQYLRLVVTAVRKLKVAAVTLHSMTSPEIPEGVEPEEPDHATLPEPSHEEKSNNLLAPLLLYALENLPEHARNLSSDDSDSRKLVTEFFLDKDVFSVWQSWYWKRLDPLREAEQYVHIQLACFLGLSLMVEDLLEAEPKLIYYKDQHGRPLLDVAAEAGDTKCVEILLKYRANVNDDYKENRSPLSTAAWFGNNDVVSLLLDRGAYKWVVDYRERLTPLGNAVDAGWESTALLLLKRGFAVNPCDELKRREWIPPLHVACRAKRLNMVHLLLKNEADIKAVDYREWTTMHYAASCGWDEGVFFVNTTADGTLLEAKTRDGETPLLVAAKSLRYNTVKLLLELGADIKARTARDESVMHCAIWGRYSGDTINGSSYKGLLELLSAAGADIHSADRSSGTPFNLAIDLNNVDAVQYLLEKDESFLQPNESGRTVLHKAVLQAAKDVIQLIIDRDNSQLNVPDTNGQTALHLAMFSGSVTAAEVLIKAGANLNARDQKGRSPLYIYCAEGGNFGEDIPKLLLVNGADANLRNSHGKRCISTLILEILMKSFDRFRRANLTLKILEAHGAIILEDDILQVLEISKENGHDFLWLVANNGRPDLAQSLFSAGKIDHAIAAKGLVWAFDEDMPPVRGLLSQHLPQEIVQATLGPYLIKMVSGHHPSTVEEILKLGRLDVNWKDNDGNSALSEAATHGYTDIAQKVLEHGATVEIQDLKGHTPLWRAAKRGHEAVAKLLLEKGAELESKNNYGQTLLSWAAEKGCEAVAKLLLEKGAELESKDKNGRTPLSRAAVWGREAVAKLLLEKGAELESKDNDGRTPLWWAAAEGHEAVAKLLLEKGAELESKDNDGRTPLWWAAAEGHEAVAELLLKMGADNSQIV